MKGVVVDAWAASLLYVIVWSPLDILASEQAMVTSEELHHVDEKVTNKNESRSIDEQALFRTHQRCRHDPMWREDDEAYERCQNVTKYKPQWTNDDLAKETEDEIWKCLSQQWVQASNNPDLELTDCMYEIYDSAEEEENCIVDPIHVVGVYHHFEDGFIITVQSAFSEAEAFGIQSLVSCVQSVMGKELPYYEERAFGTEDDPEFGLYKYGGNRVTFLNGFIQKFMPGSASSVKEIVYQAWKETGWEQMGYPDPRTLGTRTIEHLHYTTSGRLGLHDDTESIYSVSIALSDKSEYDGGHFHLESKNGMFRVPRLSAIVFLSETLHAVTEISQGQREVLVVELWEAPDVRMGAGRPTLADWKEEVSEMEEREAMEGNAFQDKDETREEF